MELRIVESGKQGGGGAEYVAMFTMNAARV